MVSGVRVSRAELFWLAYLWLADQYRLEQCRRLAAELDRAYAQLAPRLWAIVMRPSPLLAALIEPDGVRGPGNPGPTRAA